jgi:hypothetical protein
MPKDESTNSSAATSGANGKTPASRRWSTGIIAGVSAAGLGLLVAAGISGAAIGQAVDHSHRDKAGSSEMRGHDKKEMPGGRDGRDGGPLDGPGMQGPGMQEQGMQGPGMNEPGSTPGDAPVTGQSPTEPSDRDRDRGDRHDRGDRPGSKG